MVVSPRAFKGRFFTLGVSLSIIAILILMLISRVEREMDNLEQTRFDLRLAELRSALLVKQLEIQARGGATKAEALKGANPMSWMEAWPKGSPSQYLGEVKLSALNEETARGNWAYDPVERVIAYYPRSTSWTDISVVTDQTQPEEGADQVLEKNWLKFRVKPVMSGSRLEALLLESVP